ncbi:hypothetical protein chiPu_0021431, partial [Chiloscyllium punctatum]|nr:hypothetical protein [Chiloscyllium punctatum]
MASARTTASQSPPAAAERQLRLTVISGGRGSGLVTRHRGDRGGRGNSMK